MLPQPVPRVRSTTSTTKVSGPIRSRIHDDVSRLSEPAGWYRSECLVRRLLPLRSRDRPDKARQERHAWKRFILPARSYYRHLAVLPEFVIRACWQFVFSVALSVVLLLPIFRQHAAKHILMAFDQGYVPRTASVGDIFWHRWNNLRTHAVYPINTAGMQMNMQHDTASAGTGYGE